MKKYSIKINGIEYEVNIHSVEGKNAHLTVNDVEFEVEVEGLGTSLPPRTTPKAQPVKMDAPVVKPPTKKQAGYALKSPLPGIVFDINVKVGDTVKAGQVACVLEAMKMENNIEIDRDGVVEKINCVKGEAVLEGDTLLILK